MNSRSARTAFWAVFVLGIVFRVLGAWWYRNDPNADYAIVVEMVRDMAAFREWPVFFYGQPYMGSLEPSVSALLAMVFSPAPFVVCLGTALVGVLLLLAVHRWAAHVASPWAGVVAMALLVVGPPGYFQYMASPRGGYALGLLFIVILLDLSCRLCETRRVSRSAWLALGLVAGLAFWNFWLVLPAVAAAGCLLLHAYRHRLFRARVLLPGLGGFLLGSLPFWCWNLRHDWASFSLSQGGAAPLIVGIPGAVRSAIFRRLPKLLDPGLGAIAFYTAIVCLALLVLFGIVRLLLLRAAPCGTPAPAPCGAPAPSPSGTPAPAPCGTPAPAPCGAPAPAPCGAPALPLVSCSAPLVGARRTVAAALLFTLFFGAAYALSSFGQIESPRYLLPFVPLAAVLAGCALGGGEVVRPRFVSKAVKVAVLCPVIVLLALSFASLSTHIQRSRHSNASAARNRDVVDRLAASGVDGAFAAYILRGLNWAGDGRVPVTCASLERHRAIGIAVECATNVAVLENFHGFSDFLDGTGGTAEQPRIGMRAFTDIRAPAPVADIPAELIASIIDDRGIDSSPLLLDPFFSTEYSLLIPERGERVITIRLREPTLVTGVRFFVESSHSFGKMSIEAQPEDSKHFTEVSPPRVDSWFFWSGPRPYWGGSQHRTEARFPAMRVRALRLRFVAGARPLNVQMSYLQLFAPAPDAAPLDPDAIASALLKHGATRVHADRWLANELRARLPSSVWVWREPRIYGTEADAQVIPDAGTVLVVEPMAYHGTLRGIARMGAHVDEVAVGGARLLFFRKAAPTLAAYRGARFLGATLLHTTPQDIRGNDAPFASYFGGALELLSVAYEPASRSYRFLWRKKEGFQLPPRLSVFAHVLDSKGRIAAQTSVPLEFETHEVFRDNTQILATRLPCPVLPPPKGVCVGLCRAGFLTHRYAPERPTLPVDSDRLMLP